MQGHPTISAFSEQFTCNRIFPWGPTTARGNEQHDIGRGDAIKDASGYILELGWFLQIGKRFLLDSFDSDSCSNSSKMCQKWPRIRNHDSLGIIIDLPLSSPLRCCTRNWTSPISFNCWRCRSTSGTKTSLALPNKMIWKRHQWHTGWPVR